MAWLRRAVWLLGLWLILTCGRAHAASCVLAFDGLDSVRDDGDLLIVVWSVAGREVERDVVPLRRSVEPLELELACADEELASATFALVSLGDGELLRDTVLFPPDLEPASFSRTYHAGTAYFQIYRELRLPRPATPGSAVQDWAHTFTASRDPQARRPDIYVDIQPSLTRPGAWKISLSEHIANAERPLTLEVDGVSPKRVVASSFIGDLWGEATSELDDDVVEPGIPQRVAALETADVFDLPELGIQLGLYRMASAGDLTDPVLRYVRASTPANVTASDVALEATEEVQCGASPTIGARP